MCEVVSSKLGDVQALFYVVATLSFTEEDFAIVGNYGLARKITYGKVSLGDYVVEKRRRVGAMDVFTTEVMPWLFE